MVKVREFVATQSRCIVWRDGTQYRLQLDLRLLPTTFESAQQAEVFGREHAGRIRTLENDRLLFGSVAQAERALMAAS